MVSKTNRLAGFLSRKRNILLLAVSLAAILTLLYAVAYLLVSGAFRRAPKVAVQADNCYEETLRVVTDRDYEPCCADAPAAERRASAAMSCGSGTAASE